MGNERSDELTATMLAMISIIECIMLFYMINLTSLTRRFAHRIARHIAVGFIEFPNQAYTEDGFWGQIATFLPLFYLIGMIFPVIWTTKIVIADKERGMVSLLKVGSDEE